MKVVGPVLRCMPLITCVCTPIFLFITYGWAVYNGHVVSVWPYISFTGALPPESCIFSSFLNLISIFLTLIIYIRFRQTSAYSKVKTTNIQPWANKLCSLCGFFSAIGLNVTAHFSVRSVLAVHLIGAFLCFSFGTIYCTFQTVFTYKMYPEEKSVIVIRVILTVMNIASIVGTFGPIPTAAALFEGNDVLLWSKDDGGFEFHLTSSICEWILVFSFASYIGTMYWEFKQVKLEVIKIKFPRREQIPPNIAPEIIK